MTREEIHARLRGYLHDMFEVEPARVVGSAHLFKDLDLDSIDAVDLIVKLQDLTGQKVKPDVFKAVRTVDDVVSCVQGLLASKADAAGQARG